MLVKASVKTSVKVLDFILRSGVVRYINILIN